MWFSLGWLFIKEFISGEVWRLWAIHKAKEKAQAIADSPATKDELLDVLEQGKL